MRRAPDGGGFELAVTSDEVTRLRLGLEGSRPVRFADGAVLTPSREVEVRNGGNTETGYDIHVAAGLAWSYARRGLSAALQGWGVKSHGLAGFRVRGGTGTLVIDPTPGSIWGILLTMKQSVGEVGGNNLQTLLGSERLTGQSDTDN